MSRRIVVALLVGACAVVASVLVIRPWSSGENTLTAGTATAPTSHTQNSSGGSTTMTPTSTDGILFINASANREGKSHRWGQELLTGTEYQQINLVDYQIGQLGWELA